MLQFVDQINDIHESKRGKRYKMLNVRKPYKIVFYHCYLPLPKGRGTLFLVQILSASVLASALASVWHFLDKARLFLLVDLREFFFRSRVGGTIKIDKKALKMTS